MISNRLIPGLIMGFVLALSASADQVINDNLIVNGISDGTAPLFDCSPDGQDPIPFLLPSLQPDPNAAIGVIPAGDPILVPQPDFATCDFSSPDEWICNFTCFEAGSGAACFGIDCENDEQFDGDLVKLKENNLRIRFADTSIVDGVGQSWNLEANSELRGASSYFDFQAKSLEAGQRLVRVTDGAQPDYGCTADGEEVELQPSDELFLPQRIGDLPVGAPVYGATPLDFGCGVPEPTCLYRCFANPGNETRPVLTLGTDSDDPILGNGVAIGYESAVEAGVVTVGRADLLRRIAHVAAGVSATDALTVEDLQNFSTGDLPSLTLQRLADLTAQLDQLAVLVSIAEIDALIADVQALGLPRGQEKQLLTHLNDANDSLAAGDLLAAIDSIETFIDETVSLAGGQHLSVAQADALVTRGEAIIDGILASTGTGPLQDLINVLIESVEAIGMPSGLENALRDRLVTAKTSLALGDSAGAIDALESFIKHVSRLAGGQHLSTDQADDLSAQAQAIIDAIVG